MRKPPPLTPSERYLLTVIAYLRGSAHDAWARLNYIVSRRKESLPKALKVHADPEELDAGEQWLYTQASGAGLPPVTRHLPADVRLELHREFRKRVKAGFEAVRHSDMVPSKKKKKARKK